MSRVCVKYLNFSKNNLKIDFDIIQQVYMIKLGWVLKDKNPTPFSLILA